MKRLLILLGLVIATVVVATTPSAPTGLVATQLTSGTVELSWENVATDQTAVSVERSSFSNGPYIGQKTLSASSTNLLNTGLEGGEMYWYRAYCENCSGQSTYTDPVPLDIVADVPVTNTIASKRCGLFVLGKGTQADQYDNLETAYQSVAAGLAVRMYWSWLDNGTVGSNYNFSQITHLLTNLQARGKIMSLAINSSLQPPYVTNDPGVQTYTATLDYENADRSFKVARPWDNKAFMYYTNFMFALSRHQVKNVATGQNVSLRNHPALGMLRITPIGREHFARDNKSPVMKDVPGYTRALWTNAALRQVKTVQTYFQRQLISIGYFSSSDNIRDPHLNTVMLDMFKNNFNATNLARIAFWQELWTGARPSPTTPAGINLIQHRANGGAVNLQALGAWNTFNPGNWTVADGDDPGDGLNFALATYTCRAFEIYRGDFENADVGQPWYPMFTNWQSRLCGAGPIAPPPPPPPGTNFSSPVTGFNVTSTNFHECSGMVASTQNVFWINRDQGNPTSLYVMNTNGGYVATWNLTGTGVTNKDWEDISMGPGPSTNVTYVYVTEATAGTVYRIIEPANASAGGSVAATKLNFTRDSGYNCESFAVDWQTGDAFLIARGPKDSPSHALFWIADIRQKTNGNYSLISTLDGFNPNYDVTAMDITRDGRTVVVLNKNNTPHVWFVPSGMSVVAYMTNHPMADAILQQGDNPLREAVCFTHNGMAIVTASEAQPAPLTWWYRQ